jgi:hypothetical protein
MKSRDHWLLTPEQRKHRNIETILRETLEAASTRHKKASRALHYFLEDVPIDASADARFKELALQKETAVDDLAHAVHRFNDFLLRGIVPQDLNPRESACDQRPI